MLSLDFNKWINLANAHFGRSFAKDYIRALDAIREAISLGRLVVPMLDINMGEAAGSNNIEKRKRLAEFIVDLSGNVSCLSSQLVILEEITSAVNNNFLHNYHSSTIRNHLLRWGALGALGLCPHPNTGDCEIDARLSSIFQSPRKSVIGIVHALDRDTIQKRKLYQAEIAQKMDAVSEMDAGMPFDARHKLNLLNMWCAELEKQLTELGIDHEIFRKWLSENNNLIDFWHSIPGIDVLVSLSLPRYTNVEYKADINDGLDLIFLRIAIPYSNIVVTEKSWAHFATSTKIDKKYNSRVLSDVKDLPRILSEEGCLNE